MKTDVKVTLAQIEEYYGDYLSVYRTKKDRIACLLRMLTSLNKLSYEILDELETINVTSYSR